MIVCCDDFEKDLDLNSILFLRKKAELAVKKVEKDNQEVQKSQGWFSGWWSGTKKEDDADNAATNISNIMFEFHWMFKVLFSDCRETIWGGNDRWRERKIVRSDWLWWKWTGHGAAGTLYSQFHKFWIELFGCDSRIWGGRTKFNRNLQEYNEVQIEVRELYNRTTSSSFGDQVIMIHFLSLLTFFAQTYFLRLNVNMKELTVTGLQQAEYLPIMVQSRVETTKSLLDIMFETNPLDKVCV
jgi:hypothetical protein